MLSACLCAYDLIMTRIWSLLNEIFVDKTYCSVDFDGLRSRVGGESG